MSLAMPKIVELKDIYDAKSTIDIYFNYSQDYDDYDCVQIIIENNDILNKEYDSKYNQYYNEIYNNTFTNVSCVEENFITIPSGKLDNGHEYLVRIRVGIYNNGNTAWSNYSQREIIKCYQEATVSILNDNKPITKQYVDICGKYVKYYDVNGFCISDDLNYYYCELYDSNNDLLKITDNHYTSKENNFKERIEGLEDKNSYYVKLYCVSNSGSTVESSFHFNVEYSKNKTGAMIDGNVTNNNSVSLSVCSKQYFGIVDKGETIYINSNNLYDGDTEIDLTNATVKFQGGINAISDDFTIQLWLRKSENLKTVFSMVDQNNNNMELKRIDNKFYLYINSFGLSSVYVSSDIKSGDILDDDYFYVSIVFDNFYNNIRLHTEVK